MNEIVLSPKDQPLIQIEAEVISPDAFAGKTTSEIESLKIWQGTRQFDLSEFFDVSGASGENAGDTRIAIDGSVHRTKYIGQEMSGGEILVKGSAGMHAAEKMKGGKMIIEKDADSWTGTQLLGGELKIGGNAGDYLGSAFRGEWQGMKGGFIEVGGNVKSQLGSGIVGGRILVKGNAEQFPGVHMNNGLIIIEGDAERGAGAEMIGGNMVVKGKIHTLLPGFEFVEKVNGIEIEDGKIEGEFLKFLGDFAVKKTVQGNLYAGEVDGF
ncbi:MAG: formylmethanofuran dehydrogenase subunit C [Candidatus Altiarchaeales archaeon WOR_SM1_86-2]|nr:MAG: formylmethanofuran dehydrogenase subunit C [Candidatus Altiarchaeales archaeon WOR_SM1_79]ODS39285.1 MAG: formylmethanofuran dehydrogenase subunit C [Candidatus Altiarchaeales archaeon WOR_SM1_86-2]